MMFTKNMLSWPQRLKNKQKQIVVVMVTKSSGVIHRKVLVRPFVPEIHMWAQ